MALARRRCQSALVFHLSVQVSGFVCIVCRARVCVCGCVRELIQQQKSKLQVTTLECTHQILQHYYRADCNHCLHGHRRYGALRTNSSIGRGANCQRIHFIQTEFSEIGRISGCREKLSSAVLGDVCCILTCTMFAFIYAYYMNDSYSTVIANVCSNDMAKINYCLLPWE